VAEAEDEAVVRMEVTEVVVAVVEAEVRACCVVTQVIGLVLVPSWRRRRGG